MPIVRMLWRPDVIYRHERAGAARHEHGEISFVRVTTTNLSIPSRTNRTDIAGERRNPFGIDFASLLVENASGHGYRDLMVPFQKSGPYSVPYIDWWHVLLGIRRHPCVSIWVRLHCLVSLAPPPGKVGLACERLVVMLCGVGECFSRHFGTKGWRKRCQKGCMDTLKGSHAKWHRCISHAYRGDLDVQILVTASNHMTYGMRFSMFKDHLEAEIYDASPGGWIRDLMLQRLLLFTIRFESERNVVYLLLKRGAPPGDVFASRLFNSVFARICKAWKQNTPRRAIRADITIKGEQFVVDDVSTCGSADDLGRILVANSRFELFSRHVDSYYTLEHFRGVGARNTTRAAYTNDLDGAKVFPVLRYLVFFVATPCRQ